MWGRKLGTRSNSVFNWNTYDATSGLDQDIKDRWVSIAQSWGPIEQPSVEEALNLNINPVQITEPIQPVGQPDPNLLSTLNIGSGTGTVTPPSSGIPSVPSDQWIRPSYGVGALLSDVDWGNITANALMGYDPITQQLIMVWDGSSSGSGNAFVYSFRTQNWYKVDDLVTQTVNLSNFVSARNNITYIGGGPANDSTNKLADRTALTTIDIIFRDVYFENTETIKNITKVAITYQGGTGTSVSVQIANNGSGSFGTIGTLASASTGTTQEIIPLSSASYKGKKSFQIRLNGNAASTFKILDISLVYRNLGLRP